eukprot:maker-scaffold_18-snap-gene-5.4-mRNA-1 protein AED:0.03 eAED:0.03 QI:100/0.66/0.5/1/1/1/4/21/669
MNSSTKQVSACRFDHIQIYVKEVKSLEYYKELEGYLQEISSDVNLYLQDHEKVSKETINSLRKKWLGLIQGSKSILPLDPELYSSQNQDVIEQLIVGLGWRVVAECTSNGLKSFQVQSSSKFSSRMLITSNDPQTEKRSEENRLYSDLESFSEFFEAHSNRGGVAVLGFDVSPKLDEPKKQGFGVNIRNLEHNYKKLHPNLIKDGIFEEGNTLIFQVYAYYAVNNKDPDTGTVLRFVERDGNHFLSGFVPVDHSFDVSCAQLCFDHWVSNVHNRELFLKVLSDVLSFNSKVDFNAGVVAAGKAKIESTVTGNTPVVKSEVSLSAEVETQEESNEQVYLPINNALSKYGHVYEFLQELGQGVQHIASKVDDLVLLMKRVNLLRDITGRGFRSLRIPPIYYGNFDPEHFCEFKDCLDLKQLQSELIKDNAIDSHGVVNLNYNFTNLNKRLQVWFPGVESGKREEIIATIKRCSYMNVYKLVGGDFDPQTYLSIANSQILVDKQGNDVLLQIFTANILQEEPNHEAPFFEFIQRKCFTKCLIEKDNKKVVGYKKPKPGCGGFGIRNFLTLFLSIEVSKAMDNLSRLDEGDEKRRFYEESVKLFTRQLNESNPILNRITQLMEKEAEELMKPEAEREGLDKISALKAEKNRELQDLSQSYAEAFEKLESEFKF